MHIEVCATLKQNWKYLHCPCSTKAAPLSTYKYFSPYVPNACSTLLNSFPFFVSEYITRGGRSTNSFRAIISCSSKKCSFFVRVRLLVPCREARKSPKRFGPFIRSRTIRIAHVSPIRFAALAMGQPVQIFFFWSFVRSMVLCTILHLFILFVNTLHCKVEVYNESTSN